MLSKFEHMSGVHGTELDQSLAVIAFFFFVVSFLVFPNHDGAQALAKANGNAKLSLVEPTMKRRRPGCL